MIRIRTLRWHRLGDLGLASLWAMFAAVRFSDGLGQAWHGHLLEAAYHLLVAGILSLEALLFAVRGPARARQHRLIPQVVAFFAVISVLPLSALPLTWTPGWLLAATTLGLMAIYLFTVWALMSLRTSFSITPEARKFVRNGPYALVRHPLYAAYMPMLIFVGLPRLSVEAAVLVMAGIAALIVRAHYEEAILRAVFPDYAAYAAVTPRFVPRLTALARRRRQQHAGQIDPDVAPATDPVPGHI